MINVGKENNLIITRLTPNGAYVAEPDREGGKEILLPNRYVTPNMEPGKVVKVFVYTDSEDRPVATTERPFVQVGEFAYLQTVQVNRVGAFMDWGLAKNLLVPFKEQKLKMFPGGIYLVYVYLDHNSGRVVASAKIEKFLDNVMPEYQTGEEVNCLVIGHNELGYKLIVDNRHSGMVYNNEVFRPLEIGSSIKAYVKNVRPEDGKIDITLSETDTRKRIEKIAAGIEVLIRNNEFHLNDKSSPEEISATLGCSKRDFKKALSLLYREHKVDVKTL